MRRTLLVAACTVLAAAGVAVALVVVMNNAPSPSVRASELGGDSPEDPADPENPEQAALEKYTQTKSDEDRLERIRWAARQPWAKSSSKLLRQAIVSDSTEAVQLAAVEESLKLARQEGGSAPTAVVRTALASTKGNTRAAGLKAARENADPEFVDELVQLVDEKDPYATMALNALAYTDSPAAQAKITAIAKDESVDRKLRERAIALLAVTKDREARPLIVELANGEDETLRRLADEVLKVMSED